MVDFYAWGLRVTQEFNDQYESEKANDRLKDFPPLPFLKYTGYESFVTSQITFSSKHQFC